MVARSSAVFGGYNFTVFVCSCGQPVGDCLLMFRFSVKNATSWKVPASPRIINAIFMSTRINEMASQNASILQQRNRSIIGYSSGKFWEDEIPLRRLKSTPFAPGVGIEYTNEEKILNSPPSRGRSRDVESRGDWLLGSSWSKNILMCSRRSLWSAID